MEMKLRKKNEKETSKRGTRAVKSFKTSKLKN